MVMKLIWLNIKLLYMKLIFSNLVRRFFLSFLRAVTFIRFLLIIVFTGLHLLVSPSSAFYFHQRSAHRASTPMNFTSRCIRF